jgi:hypothetical protein
VLLLVLRSFQLLAEVQSGSVTRLKFERVSQSIPGLLKPELRAKGGRESNPCLSFAWDSFYRQAELALGRGIEAGLEIQAAKIVLRENKIGIGFDRLLQSGALALNIAQLT